MPAKTYEDAMKVVEENFYALDDFIKDKDILEFYKSLIAECMVEFANNEEDSSLN